MTIESDENLQHADCHCFTTGPNQPCNRVFQKVLLRPAYHKYLNLSDQEIVDLPDIIAKQLYASLYPIVCINDESDMSYCQ